MFVCGRALRRPQRQKQCFDWPEVCRITARLTGTLGGAPSRVPGVKRYWLTAARTLWSITGPSDRTIFRSDGLPVASTVISTTVFLSKAKPVGIQLESDSIATV